MKKVIFISLLFYSLLSFSQSYTSYVVGHYNVICSDNNGVTNCPSILELVVSTISSYTNTVGELDSCFVNHHVASEPWNMTVNSDSSMIGCTACGTATNFAVGKLYANDSIHLRVVAFGQSFFRYFDGFKIHNTSAGLNELSLSENALLISPNPATDMMYIESVQQNFINQPVLYDLKGARVYTDINYVNSHTYKVDVSNLPNGIYFVFVQSNKGYLKKKVVVSK